MQPDAPLSDQPSEGQRPKQQQEQQQEQPVALDSAPWMLDIPEFDPNADLQVPLEVDVGVRPRPGRGGRHVPGQSGGQPGVDEKKPPKIKLKSQSNMRQKRAKAYKDDEETESEGFQGVDEEEEDDEEWTRERSRKRARPSSASGVKPLAVAALGTGPKALGKVFANIIDEMKGDANAIKKKNKSALTYYYVFANPVAKTVITDYSFWVPEHEEIWLKRVQSSARAGKYATVDQFLSDIDRIVANARIYNSPGHGKIAHPDVIPLAEGMALYVRERLDRDKHLIAVALGDAEQFAPVPAPAPVPQTSLPPLPSKSRQGKQNQKSKQKPKQTQKTKSARAPQEIPVFDPFADYSSGVAGSAPFDG